MPLVKASQIVEDQYVRVEDDAPLPDGVPVRARSSNAMLRLA